MTRPAIPKKRRHPARRLVLPGILVLMLLSGLVFWLAAAPYEKELLVPVSWRIDQGWTVVSSSTESVHVKIQGPRLLLSGIAEKGIAFTPLLSPKTQGPLTVPVTARDMHLPKGVRLLSALPEKLVLRVAKEIEKDVNVVVALTGEPVAGYTITRISAEPDRVLLRGPEQALNPMTTVETVPVDVEKATETLIRKAPLSLPETVQALSLSSPIEVTVAIEKIKDIRELAAVPVSGKNARGRFSIQPDTIELRVQGTVQALESLDVSQDIEVFMDMEGLAPGVYVRRAVIRLPLSLTLAGSSPEVFTVRVK